MRTMSLQGELLRSDDSDADGLGAQDMTQL